MYFPDEEVLFVGEDITEAYDGCRMFFDGAANFKEVGIEVVLVSEIGQHYPVSAKIRFPCTNNMAEYESILPYLFCVQELIKRFTKIEFKHVLRIQNEFVDALATLSSMIQHPHKNFIDPIPIGIHKYLAYCAHVEEESDGNLWFHDIKEYLSKGDYPKHVTHTQKRTLRRTTPYLFVYGMEVVIPAELEIPSLRIIQETELGDTEWVQSRYKQLDLIDRKRMNVVCYGQLYFQQKGQAKAIHTGAIGAKVDLPTLG
ncbi:uncharacterized protein [Nicotiana sylvestris]